MSLYKPGDIVTVRNDLESYRSYAMYDDMSHYMNAVDAMLQFCGTDMTVDCVVDPGFYKMVEDNGTFYWSDGMFSGHVDDTPLEDDRSAWDSFFSDFFNERSGLSDDLSARR